MTGAARRRPLLAPSSPPTRRRCSRPSSWRSSSGPASSRPSTSRAGRWSRGSFRETTSSSTSSSTAPPPGPGGGSCRGATRRAGTSIVFRSPAEPSRDLVKRFVGLPGETVEIAAKRLLVDGVAREEPYAVHRDPDVLPGVRTCRSSSRPATISGRSRSASGEYLALGDNRDDSQDSRVFGPVPRSHLKGRAVLDLLVLRRRGGRGDPGARERGCAGSSITRYTFSTGPAGGERVAGSGDAVPAAGSREGRRMRAEARRWQRGEGMFGLLIGLAVLFVVVTAGIKIIPLHIHGAEMLDAMNETANFGGLKPLEKLQDELFSRRPRTIRVPVKLAEHQRRPQRRLHRRPGEVRGDGGRLRLQVRLQLRQESRETRLLSGRAEPGRRVPPTPSAHGGVRMERHPENNRRRPPKSGWTSFSTSRASSRRGRRPRPPARGGRWT